MMAIEDVLHHSADPESSDDFNEMQMMSVSIFHKEGDLVKSRGPTADSRMSRAGRVLSMWPPQCWPLVPEDSLQAWKGRQWERWKVLSLRKGKVWSGARRGLGLATQELLGPLVLTLLPFLQLQVSCPSLGLDRSLPRRRNPCGMPQKSPDGDPSLHGDRVSSQLRWNPSPPPQTWGSPRYWKLVNAHCCHRNPNDAFAVADG